MSNLEGEGEKEGKKGTGIRGMLDSCVDAKEYWNVDLRTWESLKYWMGVKLENSRWKEQWGR